ncbi:MAG: gliding motility-associated C-terminal domain-containing protein [Bacteroidota bacterium]
MLITLNRTCIVLAACCFTAFAQAQSLTASAGTDQTICLGQSVTIGGSPTATGGTGPYTYSWAPATALNNPLAANPTSTPSASTTYTVYVVDASSATAKDSVTIFIHPVSFANAGNDTSICVGDTIQIGSSLNITGGGISYSWAPATDISSTSAPRPLVWPAVSTTYTVTITSPVCGTKTDFVTVAVNPLPSVSAGPDVTIMEGQTIVLSGSGASQYYWGPQYYITYQNTANPNVEPPVTTTYYVVGVDANGCVNYDMVTVTVIPTDTLYFYNTFTPNNDGENDTWWIGNIYKYPNNKLVIYNRYGRVVFQESPYQNTWSGREFGQELPAGTYYYILDPGDGKKPYYGSVTIIR